MPDGIEFLPSSWIGVIFFDGFEFSKVTNKLARPVCPFKFQLKSKQKFSKLMPLVWWSPFSSKFIIRRAIKVLKNYLSSNWKIRVRVPGIFRAVDINQTPSEASSSPIWLIVFKQANFIRVEKGGELNLRHLDNFSRAKFLFDVSQFENSPPFVLGH